MRIGSEERKHLRQSIENYSVQNKNSSKKDIVNHLLKEGFSRPTIYKAIQRKEQGLGIQDLPRSGRPRILSKKRVKRLVNTVENKVGISCRKIAPKFKISKDTINRYLHRENVRYYKRDKTPYYSSDQEASVRRTCRRLLRYHLTSSTSLIIDDEKYFGFYNDEDPGNSAYYTSDRTNTPNDVRCKGKEKYPKKLLVYLAFSERGISKPLIRPQSSPSVNSDTYLKECIKKRIMPFVREYHADAKYIFWPDKATAHYVKKVTKWAATNGLKIVPYEDNPTNVPQARPIENLWGQLSAKVYEGGWRCDTEDQLASRIKLKIKEMDREVVQSTISSVRRKLRTIADKGPLHESLFK